jgi:glutamine synthetase
MTDYERIRVMWPDHLGLPRGKYLPAEVAERGTGHCATVFALGYDRSMIPAPGSYLQEGLIDVHSSFEPGSVRPGWEDDLTGVAVGHLTLRGEPFPFAARHVLQQAVAAWAELGYRVNVGLELEAYLMEPEEGGGWRRYRNPRAMVYGTGPSNDPDGVIDAIMRTARRCVLRIDSVNAEFDESQYELTLRYSDALSAADEAFLFRIMARETALRCGFDLTFLGKPFDGLSGSGVHVNLSLVDGDGHNALSDPAAGDGLSGLARQCLAGLCAHHQALTAVCAPTVNAYRRLQPASLSGYWANWGYDHRCVANRIPAARGDATRIESRLGDGAANIHLAVAAVLTGARLGAVGALDCPEAETGDGFDTVNTEVCSAPNLSAAIDHLEADTAFTTALGRDVVANFVANKRAEWERFTAAEESFDGAGPVTAWELDEYLPYH